MRNTGAYRNKYLKVFKVLLARGNGRLFGWRRLMESRREAFCLLLSSSIYFVKYLRVIPWTNALKRLAINTIN